ncbi:MAG: LysM peptidoglycan-binding domain-containing protein [Acidimicrobiia bacterium]|nr:LysM peptidoglycan-binding domain-containing protein [Acidimicrobiia bacterium]
MAAIAYPGAEGRPQAPARRHLHVVPAPTRARRLSRTAIYRRRRVLAVAALFLAVFFLVLAARAALGALGGGPLAAPETPAGPPAAAAAVYVVQPGDTYWTIARRLQPSGDVRALVDSLSSEHGGSPLQPGEQLVVK